MPSRCSLSRERYEPEPTVHVQPVNQGCPTSPPAGLKLTCSSTTSPARYLRAPPFACSSNQTKPPIPFDAFKRARPQPHWRKASGRPAPAASARQQKCTGSSASQRQRQRARRGSSSSRTAPATRRRRWRSPGTSRPRTPRPTGRGRRGRRGPSTSSRCSPSSASSCSSSARATPPLPVRFHPFLAAPPRV